MNLDLGWFDKPLKDLLNRTRADILPLHFIRKSKKLWKSPCVADSTGANLTFGRTLIGSLLLKKALKSITKGQDYVGVLLPASVGGTIANVAISFLSRVPVNLNFTIGEDILNKCADQCNIQTIITSQKLIDKIGFTPKVKNLIILEDLMAKIKAKKLTALWTLLKAKLMPSRLLWRFERCRTVRNSDLATVIFSSGTTGIPKGIMLTHRNILANIRSVNQIVAFTPQDKILGMLPFFHSFGYTLTLWLPLTAGFSAVYHPNPTEAKMVGDIARTHGATVMASTSTFCQFYVRSCDKNDFATIRLALVGAEKLREPTYKAFEEKFGIKLYEGYGCTEMSPVISVNLPGQVKMGSAGRPIPGVEVRVVHQETHEDMPTGQAGLITAKGPNQMKGYLGKSPETGFINGWYNTGDIGYIDKQGFIHIVDRQARFSKIGGEMVPHMNIESAIHKTLDSPNGLVVSIDGPKGEELAVLFNHETLTASDIHQALSKNNTLPKLWIPKLKSFLPVETIPVLATGKADLRTAKSQAFDILYGNA